MKNPNHFTWQCPSCHTPLQKQNKQWICRQNHCFDIAKQGYVNLLLAQHKNSKQPGDNKDMVNARRAFLLKDHYAPLAYKLLKILHKYGGIPVAQDEYYHLHDAGCGEGYYLNYIVENLSNINVYASGIDISKEAIQKASKRKCEYTNPNIEFAVGSSFKLPLNTHSQQAVIQIFAPSSASEIYRVLNDDGIWITVNPAAHHLFKLKQMIYATPEVHSVNEVVYEGFEQLIHEELKLGVNLSETEDRKNLLMMTPFYWTISTAKKHKLLDNLDHVEAHFDIQVFCKHKQG